MDFTPKQFDAFRKDLKKAVKELEKKYKVNIDPAHINYNSDKFTLKVEVTHKGVDLAKKEFETYCDMYGLKKSDYGKTFTIDGHKLKLVGLNLKARSFPYIMEYPDGRKVRVRSGVLKK